MYGVDVLQYIHIISGRKLLRQGIRILQDMNGIRHTSGSTKFWYKGDQLKPGSLLSRMNIKLINTEDEGSWFKCTGSSNQKERRYSMKGTHKNCMDNGKAYLPTISGRREYKSVLLSYRIYNRLSQEEKHKYNILSLQYPHWYVPWPCI